MQAWYHPTGENKMTVQYKGRLVLLDEHGFRSSLNYEIPSSADTTGMAAAMAALNAIAAELVDVTSSNIEQIVLSSWDDTNAVGTLPAEAQNDEEAVISVHLTASPNPEKLGILRIPAPVDGIFLTDKHTLDTSNAPLIAYVAAVAANAQVSDGETIVVARENGIKRGSWRSVSKRAPKVYA